ncbi:hypothetical protein PR048_028490 [Dryococelus australis]|uniref:DUF7869 domain-containing protein n=1 Tax=Dryococelus australis TaxID=614101 RepID=A0ABQ9GAP9_9NEOP|nr:hypothetical protein PR048_028490 [Dryococelus australis]
MVNSMKKIEPIRRSMRKRANNFVYYLTVNDRKVRVCKTFFLNTLGVSERYAYIAWDKLDELDIVGPDNRGKHSNNITKTSRMKSFPVIESHYLRTQTRRLFRWEFIYFSTVPAVLQTPCGELLVFYYKKTQNVYNFTIFDHASKNGYCYLWNETSGNKGGIEIASCVCVCKYIKATNCKVFIFYSDNCCAQNKNKFLATMYPFATHTSQKAESITHNYFVVGHTQNDGDYMNSCIEKQNKESFEKWPCLCTFTVEWNCAVIQKGMNAIV